MDPSDSTATQLPQGVELSTDIADVDWLGLKTALAEDNFDNGRSPRQLQESFERSYVACIARYGTSIVGTARALSDGVCNAYVVDVWTRSDFRSRGIGRAMMRKLFTELEGQHVALFGQEAVLYEKLGFKPDRSGFEFVVGEWLRRGRPESE